VIRRFVWMPLILGYMAILLLAAWQSELGPRILYRPHKVAFQLLDSIGFRPGMRVFGGSSERLTALPRGRCTFAYGIDRMGRRSQIYPSGPCPPEGLRWKPVVYEHMILHWTAWLHKGDYEANLSALGDHFCQTSKESAFAFVEIEQALALVHYETGERWTQKKILGRVECR
jgi:hypothetical protein